jgi:magnesium-transporting ATPase (P-type)
MTDASPNKQEGLIDAHPSRPALKTGLYTGVLLIAVMFVALVVTNRIHALEAYALERNIVFYGLFFVVMLIPVLRFLNRPLQMFSSAMIAWVMFVAAYDFAGLFFRNLSQVLRTPLELLTEGAVVYGLCAAGSWVAEMILHARHHSIAPGRGGTREAVHHSR